MKTDPKIHALATEFSKKYGGNTLAYHHAKDVLTWLAERHCITDKRAVRFKFKTASAAMKSENTEDKKWGQYRLNLLQILFPEIAREAIDNN